MTFHFPPKTCQIIWQLQAEVNFRKARPSTTAHTPTPSQTVTKMNVPQQNVYNIHNITYNFSTASTPPRPTQFSVASASTPEAPPLPCMGHDWSDVKKDYQYQRHLAGPRNDGVLIGDGNEPLRSPLKAVPQQRQPILYAALNKAKNSEELKYTHSGRVSIVLKYSSC